jgi:hypothetical protein
MTEEDHPKEVYMVPDSEPAMVPSWRLKQEAERRRKAEARVRELEQALKANRQEWVFRRGSKLRCASDRSPKGQDR